MTLQILKQEINQDPYFNNSLIKPVQALVKADTEGVLVECEVDGQDVGSFMVEVIHREGAEDDPNTKLVLYVWRKGDDEPHQRIELFDLRDDPRHPEDIAAELAEREAERGLK